MSRPTHLVALDIDGTIVDYDDRLAPLVRDTIRAVEAAGHRIVLSTGRSTDGALEVANRLGLEHGFVVASNGSVVIRLNQETDTGWEIFHVRSFDPAPALTTMREAVPTALFMVEDEDLVRWATADFPEGELASIDKLQVTGFETLLEKRATRIVMRELQGSDEEFAAAVEGIGLHGAHYSVGWSNWLDISPEGVSKASGLDLVAAELGIDRKHSVAAGDGTNDIEMLRWAAFSIAMDQGKDEVKAEADLVTASVSEDGLAHALREYFGLD